MSTQMVFIPGSLPGLNELISSAKGAGGRGFNYAKLKKQWTNDIALHAKAAKLRPIEGRAYLRFIWRERDRRRDPDNVAAGGRKLILDGLVLAKVLEGDAWAHVAGWNDVWDVDQHRPGVEVHLFESPSK